MPNLILRRRDRALIIITVLGEPHGAPRHEIYLLWLALHLILELLLFDRKVLSLVGFWSLT